jgi:7,8-dihydropterin-6-yl-methyl-4-(beta-D-ribofuranosyl)aminobenzene 5'-phosphate synthase
MEMIALEPIDGVEVTTLIDNTTDLLLRSTGDVRRSAGKPPPSAVLEGGRGMSGLRAEHGFSALVTVTKGDGEHRILFDAGLTPTGLIENMRALEVDPGSIEMIVLSHGHADHTTGLEGVIGALGKASLPVLIHPDFWTRRRVAIPGRDPIELPSTSRRALEDAGFSITEERLPSFLFGNSVLITGEVDRTTAFERGFPVHEAHRGGGWEPDPLILDDQALVVNVRDQGLLVMSGCGHAGIVNIVRYAQRLTGITRVRAVIGGFHLGGPLFEPLIDPTVEALGELDPGVVLPAHCTGLTAVRAIADRLGDRFVQNAVGSTLVL